MASISASRHTEPAKLTKLVRGELDWIVMKTLEKDRNRRYETANGLALDVQRYLADEPVQACPPSAGYRLRKFARRNKAALAVTTVFVVVLVAGTAAAPWQAVRACMRNKTPPESVTPPSRAEQAAKESEADTAAFGKFLVDDVLAVARPKGQPGGLGIAVTVRQALDAAVPKISGDVCPPPAGRGHDARRAGHDLCVRGRRGGGDRTTGAGRRSVPAAVWP